MCDFDCGTIFEYVYFYNPEYVRSKLKKNIDIKYVEKAHWLVVYDYFYISWFDV